MTRFQRNVPILFIVLVLAVGFSLMNVMPLTSIQYNDKHDDNNHEDSSHQGGDDRLFKEQHLPLRHDVISASANSFIENGSTSLPQTQEQQAAISISNNRSTIVTNPSNATTITTGSNTFKSILQAAITTTVAVKNHHAAAQNEGLTASGTNGLDLAAELLDEEDYAFFHQNSNASSTTTTTNADNVNMMFVHVGKTGGQTIKFVLKAGCDFFGPKSHYRNRCFNNLPPSKLSNTVKGMIHIRKKTIKPRQANAYLIVMRHPLWRTISWYHYVNPHTCPPNITARELHDVEINCHAQKDIDDHPNGMTAQFFECFPNLEALGQAFVASTRQQDDVDDNKCRLLAYDVFRGKIGSKQSSLFDHMAWNLARYAKFAGVKPPHVYLVRTQHLWPDLKTIDLSLGGMGTFGRVEGLQFTHRGDQKETLRQQQQRKRQRRRRNNENAVVNTTATDDDNNDKSRQDSQATRQPLSALVRRNMCCVLMTELQTYRRVLAQAKNLSPEQAMATWKETLMDCTAVAKNGVVSWKDFQETCAQQTFLSLGKEEAGEESSQPTE